MPRMHMKGAAFNASVTAWHLVDWVYNDMTAEKRAEIKVQSAGDVCGSALGEDGLLLILRLKLP
jgi:hypothetical protein